MIIQQQPNQKKKLKSNSEMNKIIVQWGTPLVILIVAITILVSNFSSASKNSAIEDVNNEIIANAADIAEANYRIINDVTVAGKVMSGILTEADFNDYKYLKNMADTLNDTVDDAYMVIIVDKNGKGVCSELDQTVDLTTVSYYNSSQIQTYEVVDSDGVIGKEATVSIVPVRDNSNYVGSVYLFVDQERILGTIPKDWYGGKNKVALISSGGDIIRSTSEGGILIQGENLFDELGKVTLKDITLAKAKMRIGKDVKLAFAIEGKEKYTVAVVPMGVNDWRFVTLINQSFVDKLVATECKTAQDMVRNLAIAIVATLLIIIIIAGVNRFKYNERSKDLAIKADTDLLTGVNNKIATERKIKEFVEENPEAQSMMLLFDVDNFKKINDTMGHAFGDEVLKTLGHSLTNEFRSTDVIGRIGGDEFVIFLKNLRTDELIEREGSRITTFFKSFKAGDYVKYSATASIGAAVFPRDGKSFEELYKACDNALYEAKRLGKNRLIYYNKDLAGNIEMRDKEAKVNPGART